MALASVSALVRFDCAARSPAELATPRNVGMAMASRMAMISRTTMSSIKVKPASECPTRGSELISSDFDGSDIGVIMCRTSTVATRVLRVDREKKVLLPGIWLGKRAWSQDAAGLSAIVYLQRIGSHGRDRLPCVDVVSDPPSPRLGAETRL